jgi:hypothetical protein
LYFSAATVSGIVKGYCCHDVRGRSLCIRSYYT